ncbi:MAG: IS1595 family transposase [Bacteroidales bacterium]|nr:IS1595 family transposase [Bacteroidales bacterium]
MFSGTRKGLEVWKEYMDCMSEGLSLDKSAERCGISHRTSFTWRHKILDALGKCTDGDSLTGIVEADETFLPVSYKGDKSAFEVKAAGRKPRERGGENHKRGLSNELVCVPCAVVRKGGALSKVAKLGKCSTEAVEKVLGGHVSKEATLCTDEDASYRRFSKRNGNDLVQIKGGKGSVKGIYHIQHLNCYHSKLKSFLAAFKGVSSKYLNNYLTWNNMVVHKGGTLAEKTRRLLENVVAVLFEETCRAVPLKPLIPVLVKNQS